MCKRNCRLEVRLHKSEMADITQKARKSGLTISSFIRKVIKDSVVKEAPPADLHMLIMEIRKIGTNIEQAIVKANNVDFVDTAMLYKELANLAEVEKTIIDTYSMVGD